MRISRPAYRAFATALAAVFAAVGLVFLLAPGPAVRFFDALAPGLPPASAGPFGFWNALAVAYMAAVTALALGMARRPGEAAYPATLAVAKLASAALSAGAAVALGPSLIYLANAAVDGTIGLAVLVLRPRPKAADRA